MSRVLTRYFLRETYLGTLAVTLILLLVYLTDRMARYLAEVAAGALPADAIFPLLGLKAVTVMMTLLPAAFYLATLLVLGRMHSENEITVLAAAGVGPVGVGRYVLLTALPVTLLVALFAFAVEPWAETTLVRMKHQAQSEAELRTLSAGRFSEAGGGDLVYFIEGVSADRAHLEGIFAQQRVADRLSLIHAESGELVRDPDSGARYLVLEAGTRYDGWPGEADYRVVQFGRYSLRLQPGSDAAPRLGRKAMPTARLLASQQPQDQAELHWRLSMPLSVLLLTALAVPLSRAQPRSGRYARLLLALLVYLVYTNLLIVARAWLADGTVAPWLGLWWVHLPLLALAAVLLARQQGSWRPRGLGRATPGATG